MADRIERLEVFYPPQQLVQGVYGFGGKERLHIAPRPMVLAAVAIRSVTGFGFNLRGDLVSLVASREDPEDYDYIRRLHATIEDIGGGRWTGAHDLEYAGPMSAETAQLYLGFAVEDALNFADDSDMSDIQR